MVWEVLSKGFSRIQTIDDVGVKGTPIAIAKNGVEGVPYTFISDSVLIVG